MTNYTERITSSETRRSGTCTLCMNKIYIDELYSHRKICAPDQTAMMEADKRSQENLNQFYLHPTMSQQQRWWGNWGSFGRHLWCQ
ncbi:hypothetical protein CJU89_2840 [Yarrowia sp. B02]|nr:hypothetical protein CJU89_2840 [Yarrowia sp. B02]